MGRRETRTQEALVAALRARPRTPYRAAQCVLGAKASFFSSLRGRAHVPFLQGRMRRNKREVSVAVRQREAFFQCARGDGEVDSGDRCLLYTSPSPRD